MPPGLLARCAGAVIVSVVVSLAVTAIARRVALAKGLVSRPTNRGVHTEPIPYLGGFGILAGLLAGMAFLPGLPVHVASLAAGAVCIAAVGTLDDVLEWRWWHKLLAQFAVAFGLWLAGVRIGEIRWGAFPDESIPFVLWSAPVTTLWVVAVMNAINFIDGLDGLAAGVGAIAGAALTGIALMWFAASQVRASNYEEYMAVAVLSAGLVGACLGFLWFNFHPARVFMGDCGALTLGLWLAGLSVLGAFKSTLLCLCPIVLLGLPLSDTAWAIFRRVRDRRSPAEADNQHIHHRVLHLFPHQRKAVLILYAVSLALSLVAMWLGRPDGHRDPDASPTGAASSYPATGP